MVTFFGRLDDAVAAARTELTTISTFTVAPVVGAVIALFARGCLKLRVTAARPELATGLARAVAPLVATIIALLALGSLHYSVAAARS